MLKRVYILPVLVVGLLSTSSWSIASPTAESSTPQIKPSSNERIQNLQMEEQEIKALYQKIEAETKLQEVQLKRKGIEKMAKAWEEAEEAKAANQKSQYEKLQAEANAATIECRLKEVKAKTELSLNSAYEACTLASYKASLAESELRLARLQMEKDKLAKQ